MVAQVLPVCCYDVLEQLPKLTVFCRPGIASFGFWMRLDKNGLANPKIQT